MNKPLVSVGMPVFNCVKTVQSAILSILHQTYDNWELLLFDDGSQDNTEQVCRYFADPRIRVYSDRTRKGLATRLNKAIELCKGKYFARQDGDDVSYPERLEKQVAFLESNPDVDLLGARMVVFRSDGSIAGLHPYCEGQEEICRHPWLPMTLAHPTWMGRVEWFKRHCYRNYLRGQDRELLLRTYGDSRFGCLNEILIGYREDQLKLRGRILGRISFCRALIHEAKKQREPKLLIGVAAQMVAGLRDIAGIACGLDRSKLMCRYAPLNQEEVIHWQRVWEKVSAI